MKHFDNPTPEVAALRERVLAWLEAGAHEVPEVGIAGFDMRDYQREPWTHEPQCGSICCIAGAAAQFADIPLSVTISSSLYEWRDKVSHALGIKVDAWIVDDADRLFAAAHEPMALSKITPAWAARVFRNWCETGMIEWARLRP